MFFRDIINDLKSWAESDDRKPLILRGARQVGKTSAVEIFSKEFDQYIYLNLEIKEDRYLFKDNPKIDTLVRSIYFIKNVTAKKGRTLIFIDEIQFEPLAVSYLRYFYEQKKDLYIIAAGSLLEVMISYKQISFPVGRVQFLYMYPMSFREYLCAINEKEAFEIYNTIPLPDFAATKLFKLFHKYTLIGGMPEIVKNYIKSDNIRELSRYYQGLLTSFIDDVAKYARNITMIEIIRHTIETAPLEAGKRIKFQNFGNSNYRSREMGEALRNLERAMILHLLYPYTGVKLPIMPDKTKSPRLQFLDTGLINFFAGFQEYFFKTQNIESIYQGKILEHITGQELFTLNSITPDKITFWTREEKQSNAEIDFIVQYKGLIIPVEIKSGKTGTLRSLHQFIDRADHNFAVRLYYGNIKIEKGKTLAGKEFNLLNLPYFLSGKIYQYLDRFIDLKE